LSEKIAVWRARACAPSNDLIFAATLVIAGLFTVVPGRIMYRVFGL
jgi:uncharacterized membrane protein